jgi:outer membrane protein TolC
VPLTPAYINRLAEEMRSNNPALLAARTRAVAAALHAEGVRIWEDPMLILGTQVADQAMKADEGNLVYGVAQKFPLFGKPQAMRRVARAEAAVEGANATWQIQLQRRELAKALFKTALAEYVVKVGAQDRAWLETILAGVEGRYRAGQVSLIYLIQAQNELSRRTNQLCTDLQLRANERMNLNRLLNRPAAGPWPVLELPSVGPAVDYNASLLSLSLKYEPRALMLREQVRQADAMIEVSRKARYPEVGLDFEGRNYSGNGNFRQAMILLNVTFPLGNAPKYRRDIARDQDRAQAARYDLSDQELAVRQELHGLTVAIDAARREALLYHDEITPRSERAQASALADWEANRGSFREVLEARRMLLEARLMYAKAVAEQWTQLSDLALCCGLGDLEALLMLGNAQPEKTTDSSKP